MQLNLGKAVKALLIAYFVLFLIERSFAQFAGMPMLELFGLVPSRFVNDFWIWQIFTYSFFHADTTHLFLNLLMLAFLAGDLESLWGPKRFLAFYFFSAAVAGVCYLIFQFFLGHIHSPMVGASGGIFGVMLAYGIIFSERTLLFMMLFPMKAKRFILILAAVELVTLVYGNQGQVSNIAHLGGMLGGIIYLLAATKIKQFQKSGGLADRKPWGSSRKSKKGHLKLVKGTSSKGNDDDQQSPPRGPTWH